MDTVEVPVTWKKRLPVPSTFAPVNVPYAVPEHLPIPSREWHRHDATLRIPVPMYTELLKAKIRGDFVDLYLGHHGFGRTNVSLFGYGLSVDLDDESLFKSGWHLDSVMGVKVDSNTLAVF